MRVIASSVLAPLDYDYINLVYTGSNLTTVQYLVGGATGKVVTTLTLVYDGSNHLTSITKT